MKSQLQQMYRNDPEALLLIDHYLLRFKSYTKEEQNRLKSDQDALAVDFESFVSRILGD